MVVDSFSVVPGHRRHYFYICMTLTGTIQCRTVLLICLAACKNRQHAVSQWYRTVHIPCIVAFHIPCIVDRRWLYSEAQHIELINDPWLKNQWVFNWMIEVQFPIVRKLTIKKNRVHVTISFDFRSQSHSYLVHPIIFYVLWLKFVHCCMQPRNIECDQNRGVQ